MTLLRRVKSTLLLVVLISGGAVSKFLDFEQFAAVTLRGENRIQVRCTCIGRTEAKVDTLDYFTLEYRVHSVPSLGTDFEGNTQSAFFAKE